MASAAVGAMGTVGVGFTAVPYVGWVVGIAAAYIDSTVIMPALAGSGKSPAQAPRLQGVPVGSNEAGAPRVWAIGSRIRVPTHILWQSSKARESSPSSSKAGTTAAIRRVYIDAMIAINDRKTYKLTHLTGNGKLLIFESINVIGLTTSAMSAVYVGGGPHIAISMASTLDPSFAEVFEVGDIVHPSAFVRTAGPTDFNDTRWRVLTVTGHTPTVPSAITVSPTEGQTMTSLAYTGGTAFSPADIRRVDDALVVWDLDDVIYTDLTAAGGARRWKITQNGNQKDFRNFFSPGEDVRVRHMKLEASPHTVMPVNVTFVVWYFNSNGTEMTLKLSPNNTGTPVYPAPLNYEYEHESTTKLITVEPVDSPPFAAGVFPETYDPAANFFDGSEEQGENALLAADKGTGNIPAYRGVAYQALDEFYATSFGDQLPYGLEAVMQPDTALTWQEAFNLVLDRAGVPASAIDASLLPIRPFLGMYMRGNVPTLTSMQPMLVAGQVIGQERDGTLALFTVDTADVVQLENGAVFSDFGTTVEGEPQIDNKFVIEDAAQEDLPTSIGVRHQDPDNAYADGYQHFGLRNPSGVSHINEVQIDLSTMVLTRREARNLATTMMRRAWVNRRRYRFTLSAAYMDLLENDVVTFTTDSGDVVRCRIIQRDMGADFRVACTGVAEDVDLEVSGSPTQSGAGSTPASVTPPAMLRTIAVDAPGIRNNEVRVPALKLAVCAENGGENWGGATVYESVDGAAYQQIGTIPNQAAIGTLETVLTAQTASEVYGTTTVTLRSQTVNVTFAYEGDTPIEAATQAKAEDGKNWCAIYGTSSTEIAAFTTVVANGNRSYTLGGWLRGLRGTSPIQQDAGFQLVMLHPGTANIMLREFGGQTPTALSYKVVPFGSSLESTTAQAVVAAYRNALPLPVRSLTKTIGAAPYDVRFTVAAHWCREVLPLGKQPPHPMDEPSEEYRFDIYNPAGSTLVRQKHLKTKGGGSNSLRDPWVTYTAAEQTADGYTPSGSETFWVDCVQVGQYGEGPSIKAEI